MADFNWRDYLTVHPAADLFPLMSESELQELADDIKQNGLQQPVVVWKTHDGSEHLVDGRNRLDALALLGWLAPPNHDPSTRAHPLAINRKCRRDLGFHTFSNFHLKDDNAVHQYVIGANVHRRHLTAEQKRDLIAKLLKAQPESSNRQIAKTVGAHHETVGAVRSEMEGRGEIRHVETRTDTKGRKQPSKKAPDKVTVNGQPISTADFSPAAQARIVATLAQKQAEEVISKLPASWETAEESAEQCEAEYVASDPDAAACEGVREAKAAIVELDMFEISRIIQGETLGDGLKQVLESILKLCEPGSSWPLATTENERERIGRHIHHLKASMECLIAIDHAATARLVRECARRVGYTLKRQGKQYELIGRGGLEVVPRSDLKTICARLDEFAHSREKAAA
jgi:DNA-binding Lrp family transcriptional regulator